MKNHFRKLQSLVRENSISNIGCADVLLIAHDHDYGYSFEGLRYAQLVDSAGELFTRNGLSTISLVRPYSQYSGGVAFNAPLTFNRFFLKIAILRRFLGFLKGEDAGFQWAIAKRVDFWSMLLNRSRVKLIVGVLPPAELCIAARLNSIDCFDLQHGIIDLAKWPYNIAVYRSMKNQFPSGFLCWDEHSADIVSLWARQNGVELEVHITGNPWFERFRNVRPDDRLVCNALDQKKEIRSDKIQILFAMQPNINSRYAEDAANDPNYDEFLCKSIRKVMVETKDYVDWNLRLHPRQLTKPNLSRWQDYFRKNFEECSHVSWEFSTYTPLPPVLARTDLLITDFSSVVVEASWFSIPSALLSPHCKAGRKYEDFFTPLIIEGKAVVLEKKSEVIIRWIKDSKRFRTNKQETDIRNSFELWISNQMLR